MQNFTTLRVDMVKKENLLKPQGGPIILTQVDLKDLYDSPYKTITNNCRWYKTLIITLTNNSMGQDSDDDDIYHQYIIINIIVIKVISYLL